jgi:hypothetical protein
MPPARTRWRPTATTANSRLLGDPVCYRPNSGRFLLTCCGPVLREARRERSHRVASSPSQRRRSRVRPHACAGGINRNSAAIAGRVAAHYVLVNSTPQIVKNCPSVKAFCLRDSMRMTPLGSCVCNGASDVASGAMPIFAGTGTGLLSTYTRSSAWMAYPERERLVTHGLGSHPDGVLVSGGSCESPPQIGCTRPRRRRCAAGFPEPYCTGSSWGCEGDVTLEVRDRGPVCDVAHCARARTGDRVCVRATLGGDQQLAAAHAGGR